MMDKNLVSKLIDIANQISRGEVPPLEQNALYTAGAFDLLLINAQGAVAFDLLAQLCKRYRAIRVSGNELKGYFDLLNAVARQTGTTEMPSGMLAIINENKALSSALREWYRVKG